MAVSRLLLYKEKNMQVQIRTDNHIDSTDAMAKWATATIRDALARFSGQITRVEVHLSDESAGKKSTAENIQCTMEARLEGHQPVAVKHHGANLNQAIEGATEKLGRLIDSTLARTAKL